MSCTVMHPGRHFQDSRKVNEMKGNSAHNGYLEHYYNEKYIQIYSVEAVSLSDVSNFLIFSYSLSTLLFSCPSFPCASQSYYPLYLPPPPLHLSSLSCLFIISYLLLLPPLPPPPRIFLSLLSFGSLPSHLTVHNLLSMSEHLHLTFSLFVNDQDLPSCVFRV